MDGQNRTKLVDSKIVFPHGITLDLVSRLVYWADAYLDYIEVVDYEGKNRHTIIQGLLVRSKYQDHCMMSKNVFCSRTNFPIVLNHLKDSELLNITFNNGELPFITAL